MIKVLVAIFGLLITFSCLASGWSSLGGRNNVGDEISIYPFWDSWEAASGTVSYNPDTDSNLYYVDVKKGGVNSEKTNQTYRDLRCEFKRNNSGEPNEFSCKKGGKSPLSGTTYKIVPNKNPKDCSFQAMFICTHGCNEATRPRKMTQSHWECYE
jgi:hypothetical protein